MLNSFAGLRNQLEQLVENFEKLGARLTENARGLREETIPPDAMLVAEIVTARKRFSDFRDAVMELAQSAIRSEPYLNGNTGSLRGLRELLETLERQEAEMRQLRDRALGLLDDVMRLEYRGGGELPDLRDCQERAAALRHRIAASSTPDSLSMDSSIVFAPEMLPEITAIANRETAFADLLDLVEKRATLDGQTATSLSLKVEEAFGRRIVIEALLGQIVFPGPDSPPIKPAAPPDSPPPAPPPAGPPSRPPAEPPATRHSEDKAPATQAASEPIQLIPIDEIEAPASLAESEDVLEESPRFFQFVHDSASELARSGRLPEEADAPLTIEHAPAPRQTVPLREIDGFPNLRQTEKFAVAVSDEDQSPPTETLRAELVSPEEFEVLEAIAIEAPIEVEVEVEREALWLGRVTEELKHEAAVQTAGSARETANVILRLDSPHWPERLRILLWQMLAEDELPLAFHLARAVAGVYPEAPFRTLSQLIRALALARLVRSDDGEIAATLRRDLSCFDAAFFTRLEAEANEDWQQAIHLALAAATLPTALFAPGADADAVLASVRLNNQLESLAGYCRTVFEFALHKQPLDPRLVAKTPDPSERQDEAINRAYDLKETLDQVRDGALSDLDRFKQSHRDPFLSGAATLCLRAIESIDRSLSAGNSSEPAGLAAPRSIDSVSRILNADLLRVADIAMNERWEPDMVSDEQIIRGVVETIAEPRSDWARAFERRVQYEDHEATGRILEHLAGRSGLDLEAMAAERNRGLQRCRESLQSTVESLRREIETAVLNGWLDERERDDAVAEIELIEQALPTTPRFFEQNAKLKSLKLNLETNRARRRAEKGDATPAPDETIPRYLKAFFPAELNKITAMSNSVLLGGSMMEDARNLLREEYLPDPVFRALKAWESIKHAGRENEDGLREILDFLGFNVRAIEAYRTRNSGDWLVSMTIKEGPGRCPVSKFGSDALNLYRLVCLNGKQPPEEIANYLNSTSDNTPAIVFYFGSLIEEQRRKLARLCNENRLIFLALDDLMLLHLCRLPQPLTEAFFHLTLPFSFLNPFNPDRPAAAEIFAGRGHELDRSLDIKGAAFVYGGRRTGKTSLLVEAERRFDKRNFRGEWEQIALYINLDAEGIGLAHPPDYLWKKLSDMFIELTGASDASRQPAGAGLFFSLLRKWLDQNPSRKVILLVDDADTFLRLDGAEGFARSIRFKALMDEPGYRFRFKVVFAGSSNVLRAAQVENHPLAHFGEPLCLGPLLRTAADAQAARQLIEKTFAVIGYEFESPDLATGILSETDYHPHLIQLYCQHLIKHLSGPATQVFDHETRPPYIITSNALREAFRNQELKERSGESFLGTLDLDKRYLLIAQTIAYHGEITRQHAFDADWIRQRALAWWPEGFRQGGSIFDIRTLLEEMEMLGVLRRKGGKYGLRGPGLKSVLGSREELELALQNADKQAASPNFEASVARQPFSSHLARRSPLTMRQFNELRKRESGVSIVFGCKAADLDGADLFLAHALAQEFTCMNKYASRGDFARTLSDLRQRPAGGVQLLFVPADCLWDEEWMAEAVKHVRKLTGADRFIRVVFAADPGKTWRWLCVNEERKAALNLDQISTLFSLAPWHDCALRAWLVDLGIAADDAGRARIAEVTGNWPIMLERFYKAVGVDLRLWEAQLDAMRDALADQREDLELAFGLHLSEPAAALRELAKRGKASAEDLSAAMRIPADEIERSLKWADLLGLITPSVSKETARTEWQPTPLVGRLLSL